MSKPNITAEQQDIEDFNEAVEAERARKPHLTRQEASAAVARADPGLHRRFIIATNPGASQRRILGAL